MFISEYKPGEKKVSDDFTIIVSIDAVVYSLIFDCSILDRINVVPPVLCFETIWIYEDNSVVNKHDSISDLNSLLAENDGWQLLRRVTRLVYDVDACLDFLTNTSRDCDILKVRYSSGLTAYIVFEHDSQSRVQPIEYTVIKLGEGFLGVASSLADIMKTFSPIKITFCVI